MKKKLRTLLVRYFALQNFAIINGKKINGSLRVACVNSTIGALGVIIGVIGSSNNIPFLTGLGLSVCVPMLFFYFFTKYYFNHYPVKWDELDFVQKYQFGESLYILTDKQDEEWRKIRFKVNGMIQNKENFNVFPVLLPFINIAISIIFPLVYLLLIK